MTEPQELRSIDELFRNTFNNLPDTPAENGWDLPSDQVWQHVRENIKAPRSGWSLKSKLLLAGFAVTVAIGLYFAFATPQKVEEKQAEAVVNVVKTPEAATEAAPVAAPEVTPEGAAVVVPVHKTARAVAPKKVKNTPAKNVAIAPVQTADTPAKVERDAPRMRGAVPLPGTPNVIPNTTEELKAERARQLEKRWKTPLKLLPMRRITNFPAGD
jgi:hypothetical protein